MQEDNKQGEQDQGLESVQKEGSNCGGKLEDSIKQQDCDNMPTTQQEKISECISRIKSAWIEKDYFRVLELPYPELDAWGQPLWSVGSDGVVRAYRKITKFIHPDKNPSEEAKKAFLIATECKDALVNDRAGALRDSAWLVKRQLEKSSAQEDWQSRIQSSLIQNKQKEKQRTEEMKKFESNIAEELKWRAYGMKNNKRGRNRRREEKDGQEDDWEAAAAHDYEKTEQQEDTVVIKKPRKKIKTLF